MCVCGCLCARKCEAPASLRMHSGSNPPACHCVACLCICEVYTTCMAASPHFAAIDWVALRASQKRCIEKLSRNMSPNPVYLIAHVVTGVKCHRSHTRAHGLFLSRFLPHACMCAHEGRQTRIPQAAAAYFQYVHVPVIKARTWYGYVWTKRSVVKLSQ